MSLNPPRPPSYTQLTSSAAASRSRSATASASRISPVWVCAATAAARYRGTTASILAIALCTLAGVPAAAATAAPSCWKRSRGSRSGSAAAGGVLCRKNDACCGESSGLRAPPAGPLSRACSSSQACLMILGGELRGVSGWHTT